MGSGASQEVSTKVKDNSADDIEKLFKELPADELQKVLKAAQAATGAKDSGSSESSAPFLRKAFTFLVEQIGKHMEAEENGAESEEMDEEKLMETYMGFIKQSFDHHDKKKAGKLDKDDAAVFFKHFLQESSRWLEAMMTKAIQIKIASIKKEFGEQVMEGKDEYPNAKDHLPGAMKVVQAEMNKLALVAKAKAKGNAEAFAANKDALTCVAFTGTDDDGDGTLTLEEFCDLMSLGSEKFEALTKMLGVDLEACLDDQELEKATEAAKEAGSLYMRDKLGIKED